MPPTQLRFYQYPACSTCRKAAADLKGRGIEVESIDITKAPPSAELLAQVAKRAEVPLEKLFNTSGQSYREGDFKTRLKVMSDQEKLEALAADGKLIKRPILLDESWALVGYQAQAYEARLAAR